MSLLVTPLRTNTPKKASMDSAVAEPSPPPPPPAAPAAFDDDYPVSGSGTNSTALFVSTGAIVLGIPLVALGTALLIKYCATKMADEKLSRSDTGR